MNIPTTKFFDARRYCLKKNADLVTISSAEENTFVLNLAHIRAPDKYYLWIGLHGDSRNRFRWLADGTSASDGKTFSNWKAGEPNGGSVENCGHMLLMKDQDHGKWNDLPCDTPNKPIFACERILI